MIAATYVSSSEFTVVGNHEVLFEAYVGLKCVQGIDGTFVTFVEDSEYAAGTGLTTVTVADASLTANLTNVLSSYVAPSSLPSIIPQKVGGATGQIPIEDVAYGTPDGTQFVRDDGMLAVPQGTSPTGDGFIHITDGVQDDAAKLVENVDVDEDAGIAESKLALNYATHANTNDPTADQNAALAGTSGTAPSATNKFVDNADTRMTNARTPSSHGNETHSSAFVTQSEINTHANNTSNPHSVTAAQVGNETAQWNAYQLQGIWVDATAPTDGYTLIYSAAEDAYIPAEPPGASGGEANTMSSVDNEGATAGVALYDSKSIVDLRTKSLDGEQFEASGAHEVKIKASVLEAGGSGVTATGLFSYAASDSSVIGSSYAGNSLRVLVPASSLPFSGTKLRIGVFGVVTQTTVVDHASVVLSTTPPNGDTTPTEITFGGGGSGFTAPIAPAAAMGVMVYSDWMSYVWNAAAGHLIIFDLNSGGTQKFRTIALAGVNTYYKAASASYNVAEVSGYSTQTGNAFMLASIEIS